MLLQAKPFYFFSPMVLKLRIIFFMAWVLPKVHLACYGVPDCFYCQMVKEQFRNKFWNCAWLILLLVYPTRFWEFAHKYLPKSKVAWHFTDLHFHEYSYLLLVIFYTSATLTSCNEQQNLIMCSVKVLFLTTKFSSI